MCAARYVDGHSDTKVIDPIKENFPSCTMPLSCTTPVSVTPAIMHNQEYAAEYLAHVSLIRELLEQSLTPNPTLLASSGKVVRLCDRADAVSICLCVQGRSPILHASEACHLFDRFPAVLLQMETYPSLDQEGNVLEELAINNATLQFKLYTDGEASADLDKLDNVECNNTIGMHISLW